jgi:putative addiction module component (TIGR02574 family)
MSKLRQLGIDRMSVTERIALAQEILDSVAAEQPFPPLSEHQHRELDRRLADADTNPDDTVPWEQVEIDALKRLA